MDAMLVGAGIPAGFAGEDDYLIAFKVVCSRKYGMRRGVNRNVPETTEEEAEVCERTIPWLPLVGDRRKVRQWAQIRKGGGLMTKEGYAYFTYGTYGPYGIEF